MSQLIETLATLFLLLLVLICPRRMARTPRRWRGGPHVSAARTSSRSALETGAATTGVADLGAAV